MAWRQMKTGPQADHSIPDVDHFLAEKMQAWMDGGVNHSHIHEKSL